MTEEQSAEIQRAQIARWSRLSYAQRIDWLWEAKLFAQRAISAAQSRAKDTNPSNVQIGDERKAG